jgi:hypothetical protein
MNVGIVTSFIVGGLLLLSILTLNVRMSEFANNSTVDMIAKNRVETISELISNDLKKIGQDLPGSVKPFVTMDSDRIKFRADTFFGDNRPFSMITWDFKTNQGYSKSKNPNDFLLSRDDNIPGNPGNNKDEFPVTFFKISYLDKNGDPVLGLPANQSLISRIHVEIICESEEPVGTDSNGNDIYSSVMWSKTFYPENLQFSNQ